MSTIAVDNVTPSGGGTSVDLMAGLAKFSVMYDQATPAIDTSENVSSVTDSSTGQYVVICTNAFTSATRERVGSRLDTTTAAFDRVWHGGTTAASTTNTPGCTTGNSVLGDTRSAVIGLGDLA